MVVEWKKLTQEEEKEVYRYIAQNYLDHSPQEVADNVGLPKALVMNLASLLRRRGVRVPKHNILGVFSSDFLGELNDLVDSGKKAK
jgi:hypothetical protein